jgi:hypothetical protein
MLSALLETDLISESYIPVKEFREKRSFVRHTIVLSSTKTKLANKMHAILDKYEYSRTELTIIFDIHGIQWLKTLLVSLIDKIILDTTLTSIESIDKQMQIISKEFTRYVWHDSSKDVEILLSI